jgi:hypothetical protein
MTINNYRKYGLDGIRNRRKNGCRRPVISTERNKEMIKDITKQIAKDIWLSQKHMEYQATAGHPSFFTSRN